MCVLISTLSPVRAQNCGPRIRKDWDALTTAEKDTYKGALAAAMDSGAYIKFIEIHTDMQSDMHAHRQCMFIYWHRLLLVVFENMLRGQGPQFACVTVPYYNWMAANNRVLAGTCSSLGDCSDIMRDLGGSAGQRQRVSINGVATSGRCVSEAPLDHFCQSGAVSGSQCVGCVPRGDWDAAPVPASTSYASIRQQLFNGRNIGQMSPLIEQGCHNQIHSSLSGAVQTLASPADPIFWSHHSMVDALHTIFHKCRVGNQRMTFAQKSTHPVAWTSCSKRGGGNFNPSEVIVMRTGINGVNPIQGSQDPVIGRYFAGVPDQYAGLMDGRDLGASSYSYELSGQLADLFTNCDGTPSPGPQAAAPVTPPLASEPVATPPAPVVPPPPSAPMPINAPPAPLPVNAPPAPVPVTAAPLPVNAPPAQVPVNAPPAPAPAPNAPVAPPAAPQRPRQRNPWDWLRNFRRRGDRRLEAEHDIDSSLGKVDSVKIHGACGGHANAHVKKVLPSTNAPAVVAAEAPPATAIQHEISPRNIVDVVLVDKTRVEEKRVSTWYEKTTAAMGGHGPEVTADLERQVCMFENQCLGGTPDYSDEFKATWGVKAPRCLLIVQEIESGKQAIAYGKWREDMESRFGCPNPANATQSINETDVFVGSAEQSVPDMLSSVEQSVPDMLSSVEQSV
uniref:Tyrosinase copper-binding domain-containing protein n=1 Tax=Hyaloperonospora arabidopsidis (strain Emoy2) TaxID=559515 RepID=M4C4I8_HYAAE